MFDMLIFCSPFLQISTLLEMTFLTGGIRWLLKNPRAPNAFGNSWGRTISSSSKFASVILEGICDVSKLIFECIQC